MPTLRKFKYRGPQTCILKLPSGFLTHCTSTHGSMRLLAGLSAVAALLGSVQALPKARSASTLSSIVENGIEYSVFNHGATGAKLQFVNNSGICETTEGVNQYSGYISVGEKMNMWFWYVFTPTAV